MNKHFQQEFDNLCISLAKMATLVEEQVEAALVVLETGNIENHKAIKNKDKEIDAYDNLVMIQCENIFALFQPVAQDLRYIMSAIKVNNQLERCGDIAVNISQRAKRTADARELVLESNVIEMGKAAVSMVKKAIQAFNDKDTHLADQVLLEEDIVDKMNKHIFKFLVEKMKTSPEVVEPASHLIVLTRQLERLADHATNIAEDVYFVTEARILAHAKKLNKAELD